MILANVKGEIIPIKLLFVVFISYIRWMSKRVKFTILESLEELKILRRKQKVLYKERRLLWLALIKETNDISRELSSKTAGISLRTQERWIERYISGGIEGLLTDKPNLKKSKIITDQIHQGLSERVNSSENPFLGYWDAKQWVLSEYGVEITYHWIRAYLIKHFKTKLKSPRKSHYKKEPEAQEAFLKTS